MIAPNPTGPADDLEREAAAAERAYIRAVARRRAAVVAMVEAGKSEYRAAQVIGRNPRTIRAILKAARGGEPS